MNYQNLVFEMLSKLINNNWSKLKTAAASKHGIIHTAASYESWIDRLSLHSPVPVNCLAGDRSSHHRPHYKWTKRDTCRRGKDKISGKEAGVEISRSLRG